MEIAFEDETSEILERLARCEWDAKEWFDLKARAEQLSLASGFERLLSLDSLGLALYDHQRSAVLRVLREMRGRAILADEVGLGKTIEACVILKEYMLRSLVKRALVLVPASLVAQWSGELAFTFGLPFEVGRKPSDFARLDLVLASIDTAKRPECREAAQRGKWDLVIVDEAHRLKNRSSLNWKFVNGLRTKYLLLLTATPVQNDLRELYNLVTLLVPGQLKTFSHFKRAYMLDKHSPKNTPRLKEALREVMVRTGRRESLLPMPRRAVRTVPVELGRLERDFYERALVELRSAYRAMPKGRQNPLPFILALREASSHPKAALRTLRSLKERGLLGAPAGVLAMEAALSKVVPAKLAAVVELLGSIGEKAIVFTEFRTSQQEIVQALNGAGKLAIPFHGGMSGKEKEEAIARFEESGDVLVSTEAGAEGRNLQFCRIVVNFDLPWNPMRVEQRIGRVHRIGQTRDVLVANLVAAGTIESYVLELLDKKLGMFERVIGEVDEILSRLEGGLEGAIGEAALMSEGEDDMKARFDAIGEAIEAANLRYDAVRRLNAAVLDGEDAGGEQPAGA